MKICLIGAGKRVHEMYIPVLSSMKEVEVAGVWNRTASKLSSINCWKTYEDQTKMIEECQPDALLIVVNSSAIKNVVLDCMKYQLPIIMETPVWDREIPDMASKKNLMVFVNEQTPYLPCEEFKMMLLKTGEFGSPIVAMNDFRTFEFHGIAQLRRYIGYEKQPIEVLGSCTGHVPISYCDNNDKLQQHTESWEFGVIKFNSGQTAVYNFSSIYNRAPFRKPRSTRIYCNYGTITSDDNQFNVHLLEKTGRTKKIDVQVEGPYMDTHSIECEINGKNIVWKKKEIIRQLNDQQVAIRKILEDNLQAIKDNNTLLGYPASSALLDMHLLNAIRFSSQNKKFIF